MELENETAAPADNSVSLDQMLEERKQARAEAAESDTAEIEAENELDAPDEQEIVEDADTTELEADQTAEDTDELETVNEGEDEAPEAQEEETASIEPPTFWDEHGKKHFSELDPVTQEFILAQDKTSQAAVTRAQMEAADKVRTQTAEITQQVQVKLTQLEEQANIAEMIIADKYAGVTSEALHQAVRMGQMTAEDAMGVQLAMQSDLERVEALKSQLAQEQSSALQTFVENEAEKLKYLEPDLVDPEKGAELRQSVGKYLIETMGVAPEALSGISAAELSIAHKAKRWDDYQAAIAKKPKPKPRPKGKNIKPGKSSRASTSKVAQAKKRFQQTGSQEDYLALKRAQRAS